MYNLNSLFTELDKYAPLSLSQKMIDKGCYDNSGILINVHSEVNNVLFALDLTNEVVLKAKRLKCDTIVTHHPVIYNPIKSLSVEEPSSVLKVIENKINVISMHLNLDIAENGIDGNLCFGLGGNTYKILDFVDEKYGYGREFEVNTTLIEMSKRIKKEFKTRKVLVYGKRNTNIKKVASFCGGGSQTALETVVNKKTDADLIVTSDIPHHVLLALIESGKCVIIIPHYVSEIYGFKKFYEQITKNLKGKVNTFCHIDRRFM